MYNLVFLTLCQQLSSSQIHCYLFDFFLKIDVFFWFLMTEKCVCCCRSELIVKKFLDLDLETDDLESFLRDFVMPTSEGKLWKCFLRTAVEKNHWFGNHSVVWWNWSQLGAMLNLSITLVHVQLRNHSTDKWRRFCLNYTFFIEKYIEQQSDHWWFKYLLLSFSSCF